MSQSIIIMFILFSLNTAFLCPMDQSEDTSAVVGLSKRLGSLKIVSHENRQTRYGQVKSCEALSKKIDDLVENDRSIASIKAAVENRVCITERKAIDALKFMYSAIPTAIDGLNQEGICDELYMKNRLFRSLVDQLVSQKSRELNGVIGSTVDTVLAQRSSFPALSLTMKKYLLAQAEQHFHRNYFVPSHYLFTGHTDLVLSIDYHHKTEQLVSGSADGTVRFWNIRTGKCEHIHTCVAPAISLDYSWNGSQIAIATNACEVILLDSQTYAVREILTYDEPIAGVSWSHPSRPGGTQLHLMAASNISKSLYVRDMALPSFPIIAEFQLSLKDNGHYDGFKSIGESNLFKVVGNNICLTEENNKIVSLCMKAFTNSFDDVQELKKLYASQLVKIMWKIYKDSFKSKIMARIVELENEQK